MTILEKAASLYSSPIEVQHISNLAHNLPGLCLIVMAGLLFIAGLGYKRNQLIMASGAIWALNGIGFALYVFLGKGITNAFNVFNLVMAYPAISIHIPMITATIIGGIADVLYARGKIKGQLILLIFPAALMVNGYINVLHPHEGDHTGAYMFYHSLLGALFILTGVLFIIYRLINSPRNQHVFLVLATISMISVGGMLMSFKEPPYAYSYAFPAKTVDLTKENPKDYIDEGDSAIVYISKQEAIPRNIRLKKGGQIKFIQVDASYHEISSGPHPTHSDYPPLNIGFLEQGKSHIVTFPKTGLYGFHDHLNDTNQEFWGKIVVYE